MNQTPSSFRVLLLTVGVTAAAVPGCVKPVPGPVGQVADAWESPPPAEQVLILRPASPGPAPRSPSLPDRPIAAVNGAEISREEFVQLLLEGHALPLLEAMVILQAARQRAESLGIHVTQADIDAEYERQLIELSSPLGSTNPSPPNRGLGEQILQQILTKRNMSHREYMLLVERNACLRQIAASQVKVTDDMLPAEYERAYGEKVQIRHIQLASRSEVLRVQALLKAGSDFATVAREHSRNRLTAPKGGLLPAFTRDDDVPKPMRETAFALKEGQVSAPIFEDNWFQIIKLEKRFPPSEVPIAHMAEQLGQRIRDRLIRQRMDKLVEELFRDADVRIHDPQLRRQFEQRHSARRTAARPG